MVQDFAENVFFRNLGVFGSIGGLGLLTAMIAAGVALRGRCGAPLSVPILLGLSRILIGAHPPPYGPSGLALLVIAVLLYLRSQSPAPASGALGQAGSG